MSNALISLALWACQFAALYAWALLGIEGAGNLLTAWVVALFVMALVYFVCVDIKKPYEPPRGLPRWFARALSVAFIVALVWFGHGWLAFFYSTFTVLVIAINSARATAQKRRQEQAA